MRFKQLKIISICISFLAILSYQCVRADDSERVIEFKIERQALATALLDFSYQSDVQVVMPGPLAEGILAIEVAGRFTIKQALDNLLLSTGLDYEFTAERTITIKSKKNSFWSSRSRRKRFDLLGIEQMFVTAAQEHDEIIHTTVSKVVLSGEDLESRGVTNADELQQFVPGLTVESPQTGNTEFSIRGAGISDDDLATQSGVAVFIDDIYIPRQSSANMAIYELDRVNILRGPQSTFYAHNATGGAISYVTRKPTSEFEARYLVEAGNRSLFNNLLTVNGELKQGVTGQVAFASFGRGQVVEGANSIDSDNDVETNSGRATIRINKSDKYEWLVGVDGERRRQSSMLYSIGPNGSFQFAEGLATVEVSDPVRSSEVDTPGFENLDIVGAMVRLNVEGSKHRASYIFGHRSHQLHGLYDLDQSSELLVNKRFSEESETVSLEARWSSLTLHDKQVPGTVGWALGVLVLNEDAAVSKAYDAPGLNAGDNQWDQTLVDSSYSAYGSIEYQWLPRFRVTAGLRYLVDFREFGVQARTSNAQVNNPYLQENYEFSSYDDWRRLTPQLGVQFRYSDHTSYYLNAATGYKPGGHRGTATNFTAANVPFKHESVSNLEFGIRNSWLDDRMKLNSTAFFADYRDMQISAFNAVGQSTIHSAEKVGVQGFEVELQARPVTSLKISVGLSFIDARFDRFLYQTETQSVDKGGDRVPRIPDVTFNLSVVYLFPDTPLGSWSLRTDAVYSEEAKDIDNHQAWPNYRNYNFWLDYLPHNGRWELTLWVKNVRDKEYFQASSPGISNQGMAYARKLESPRTSGLSLKYFW